MLQRPPIRRKSGAVGVAEGDDRPIDGGSRCEVERDADGGRESEDDEREPVGSFRGHARN